jgi:hypothetical protein
VTAQIVDSVLVSRRLRRAAAEPDQRWQDRRGADDAVRARPVILDGRVAAVGRHAGGAADELSIEGVAGHDAARRTSVPDSIDTANDDVFGMGKRRARFRRCRSQRHRRSALQPE